MKNSWVIVATVAFIVVFSLIAGMMRGRKSPILAAAFKGDGRKIAQLLKKGVDINTANGMGGTAIVYAAQGNHKAVVEYLLNKGANPNAIEGDAKRNKFGMTALMYAALNGNGEIVKILLAKGADQKLKNNSGQTVMMQAAFKGKTEIVQILLDAGGDVNDKDNWNRNAWNWAQEGRNPETMALLKRATLGKRMAFDH